MRKITNMMPPQGKDMTLSALMMKTKVLSNYMQMLMLNMEVPAAKSDMRLVRNTKTANIYHNNYIKSLCD